MPRQKHHELALLAALDQLYLYGSTVITWEQLYLWFDAERLNKRPWRQLSQRWEECCEGYKRSNVPTLTVLSCLNGFSLARECFDDAPTEKGGWVDLSSKL